MEVTIFGLLTAYPAWRLSTAVIAEGDGGWVDLTTMPVGFADFDVEVEEDIDAAEWDEDEEEKVTETFEAREVEEDDHFDMVEVIAQPEPTPVEPEPVIEEVVEEAAPEPEVAPEDDAVEE